MPQLKEIMTRTVDVISPNDKAADAAKRMKDLDVGAIPVCDGEELIGMITDRDLVLRVMALMRDPTGATVGEAMTHGVVYCYEDEDAEQAAQIMAEKQIRRLPVLSRAKRLVGIVSLGDLALEGTDHETSGAALKHVSEQP